jgi:hypothetical protein
MNGAATYPVVAKSGSSTFNVSAVLGSVMQLGAPRRTQYTKHVLLYAVIPILITSPAMATSIVVQLEHDHIIFAADTRGLKQDTGSQSTNEGECKIVPLGTAAFAITGNMDYVRHQLDDAIASWDSRSDAREAYIEQHGNLVATADNWAARAKRHYSSFYLVAPNRVKELAAANSQNILVRGMFVGFTGKQAVLVVRDVYLDEKALPPILEKSMSLPERSLPYTSNGITQELIEGHSARKATADAAWLKLSSSIRSSSMSLRHVEFLIQATAQYDATVGERVNVLRITLDHSPRWLQNFTCPQAKTK